jgi:secreted PhoX family phosphatase
VGDDPLRRGAQDFYGDLETTWSSSQKFVPGNGFDPGQTVAPAVAASRAAEFGRMSGAGGGHPRDAYGYLAEVDPGQPGELFYLSAAGWNGDGRGHRKVGALGRARWENASFAVGKDWQLTPGQPVVFYAGDDRRGGRIFKWVSQAPYVAGMTRAEARALLDEGTLYVAHFAGLDDATGTTLKATGQPPTEAHPGEGRWIRLSLTSSDVAPNAAALGIPGKTVGAALRDVRWNGLGGFSSDNDVRLALFTAANKIGVMELNRPEDVEWNPKDRSGRPRLYVSFTNHGQQVALDQDGVMFDPARHAAESPLRADTVGSIFALEEQNPANPAASSTFKYISAWQGSAGSGLFDAANPDNLVIDQEGGVWFGTDGNFGKNGTADAVYYLDLEPAHRPGQRGVTRPSYGKAFRIASVPADAEATGPAFNADQSTLFLSVQHPGESIPSTWPQVR